MNPTLVLYGTRQGQARRIAERLAGMLAQRGCACALEDAAQVPVSLPVDDYGAVVIVASVHLGRHEREVAKFLKQRRTDIEARPCALVSVSLSQATAENASAPPDQRAKGAADAGAMIDALLQETGWHPDRIKAVAGALRYSKYNWFLRFIMQRIAVKAGAASDASRDYEYTDWDGLEQFASDLADLFLCSAAN